MTEPVAEALAFAALLVVPLVAAARWHLRRRRRAR
jgi:hypothetical protein